jgi:hypothetical protein
MQAFLERHRAEILGEQMLDGPETIKMYDKQGSVMRVETTINNPRRFKVRRVVTRKGACTTAWVPTRKSVADIRRRVEVSRTANERYFEALGVVGDSSPTRILTAYYRVTPRGRHLMTTALRLRETSVHALAA